MLGKEILRFEDVEVDLARNCVVRDGREVHLRQKTFQVFAYLIQSRERLVTKDELFAAVWENAAVTDDVLVQCVKEIRRSIGDDPHHPRFIRTVPKLGYRFISPVVEDLNGSTTTHTEEITRVEVEIEEESNGYEKGIASILASRLTSTITSRRARVWITAAAVIVISVTAGLLYFAPTQFGARNSDHALTQTMTDDPEAFRYYTLGVEKAQAVQNKEAIEYFEKAIELDPEFAMAHARIGYVYALSWAYPEKGKPFLARAREFPNRLSEKDKLHVEAWYAIADQDYSAAIQTLREIISSYPLESEAYWRLGKILTGEGQHEEAIAVLERGLAADPEAKDIYNFLGGLNSLFGRHDEAIALQKRYVELAPGEPNAYDSLGMAYQHAGSYIEAVVQYQRALDLKPDFEVALAHLANTRFQQGRYSDAIELYNKYLAVAPSEIEQGRGYSRLAIIYCRQRNFEQAAEAARGALNYNKEDFSTLLVALERGDMATARDRENQLFGKSTYSSRGVRNDSRVKFYLQGMIALERRQTEEALENFRQTLKLLPPTWDLLDFEDALANAFLKTGQFEQSITEYQRILTGNPNYPLAHFHIAQAFERMGQRESASENYKRFLEVWKDADADIPEVIAAQKFLASNRL